MTDPDSPNPSPELHGLDPGELLARGLNTVRPSGGRHDWTPPTPGELARLLPQYHIESMLGHGGMGAVYKGVQEKLGRTVAIKLLPAELTADEQFVVRFEREARTLARLQHPGIVSIYEFGQTTDGHLFFVMEYVDGTDLRRILQGPGLDPEQALEIIVQVCEALQAAHRQGVIHRDIKPANILITSDGRVKLADFGLARPDYEEHEGLTRSNIVMGTPDYMAPEQHGGQTDHRADIFALGLTLYEMLTGKLPRGAFEPPSRKVRIDVRIDEVVIKALQEEPDLRYQQASEMKTAVDHIRTSVVAPAPAVPLPPSPPVPPPSTRGRTFLLATLVLAALLGLGAILLLRKNESPSRQTPPVAEATPAPKIGAPAPVADMPPSQTSIATPAPAISQPPPALPSAVAPEQPASLEEALTNYRWDYKTTKSTYSFSHSLMFLKDGTVFSIGFKKKWRFSWVATGPRTVHIDMHFVEGYQMDLTFDESFAHFEGRITDGSPVAGTRTRLFTAQDREDVARIMKDLPAPAAKPAENADGDDDTAAAAPTEKSPPPPASPEEILTGHTWTWTDLRYGNEAPNLWNEAHFEPDGTFTAWHDDQLRWSGAWKASGARQITLFVRDSPTMILVFDKTFTRFDSSNTAAKVAGVQKAVRSATIPSAVPSPTAAPLSPMEAARQILLSYQWRYVTPNFDKVIVFTADGLIKNVDGSPPVRQWQMIDGNSFIVRSANNSNVSNFNNDFTRFEGHTLKRPFKVYGSRLGRVQQTAPGKTGSSHHP